MGGWFGDIARGIGQAGSDIAAGSILQQQLQQAREAEALRRQAIEADINFSRKMLEMQTQKFNRPEFSGMLNLPGGAIAAANRNPATGQISLQTVVPALVTPDQAIYSIEGMKASLPPRAAAALDLYANAIRQGEDPYKTLEQARKFAESQIARSVKAPTINPTTGQITDAYGNAYSLYDPSLPKDLRPLRDAFFKRQEEIERQKLHNQMLMSSLILQRSQALMPLRVRQTLANGAVKNLTTQYQGLLQAEAQYKTMQKNYADAVKALESGRTNQQAEVSLLANHLGMTAGGQKIRITQAMWNEAMKSRPWLAGLAVKWDNQGVLTGITLTKDQMAQMVELAKEKLDTARDMTRQALEIAKNYGVPISPSQEEQIVQKSARESTPERVNVIGPDGAEYSVPKWQVPQALKEGYKLAPR